MTRVIKKLKEHSNLNSNNLKEIQRYEFKLQNAIQNISLPEVVLDVKENN